MDDKDKIMIEEFFKQAAKQQIEDNGFTERVLMNLPDREVEEARRLSRLWTLFCLAVGSMLFFLLGGWPVLKDLLQGGFHMLVSAFEVLLVTATTTEIPVNPWALLLTLGFVIVFLPYQIARKLYVIQ